MLGSIKKELEKDLVKSVVSAWKVEMSAHRKGMTLRTLRTLTL